MSVDQLTIKCEQPTDGPDQDQECVYSSVTGGACVPPGSQLLSQEVENPDLVDGEVNDHSHTHSHGLPEHTHLL